MKESKYILILVLAFCWTGIRAQITELPGKKSSASSSSVSKPNNVVSSDPTIENNVRNNLIIIEQNYQLQDVTSEKKKLFIFKEKSLFGRGGNKFFGSIYTVGIKVEGGVYTDGRAALPWLYDPNYNQYRNRNQYVPIIAETNYRLWGEQKFQKFDADCDPGKLSRDSILFINKKIKDQKLTVDTKTGTQKGWIVWILKDDKTSEPDAFTLLTQAFELKFEASGGAAEFTGNVPQNVIYGLFVTEQENPRGQILTVLSGFAVNDKGKWVVKKPAVAASTKKSAANVNPNQLTPTK